jgi:RNA-directed DNA polymerase
VVKRKTAKGRLQRALQTLSAWCQGNLHQPIAVQHQKLSEKLRGHYAYYGIIGNLACLGDFLLGTRRIWRRWLGRRGQAGPPPGPTSSDSSNVTASPVRG